MSGNRTTNCGPEGGALEEYRLPRGEGGEQTLQVEGAGLDPRMLRVVTQSGGNWITIGSARDTGGGFELTMLTAMRSHFWTRIWSSSSLSGAVV